MTLSWKEIQEKSPEELRDLVRTWKEELRTLRFSVSQGQLKNVRSIRAVRQNIAQALTKIHKK
ncbi:50S ribosomal protein L29 [Candidatus Uhrbacteria bacterium]|nr:50S ribosomal protein L29 [Candidatus Uhrbacteria bacterium]